MLFGCNLNRGMPEDGNKRSAAAVRERISPALTIVRDESPYGHGLHRMCGYADWAVVNARRDTEQNYAVLCGERGRRLFHDLLPAPALRERRHCGLACRLIAVGRCSILVVSEGSVHIHGDPTGAA
jgi:LmbE family N-acetylglucosaminyl deacetylase